MATALVMRGLNQQEPVITAWPTQKLFTYAKIAAVFEGREFK